MKIGFLGAGKMAEGILAAIDDKGAVVMAEKVAERRAALARAYGVDMTDDVAAVARRASLLFLAVRPQDVDAVAAAVKPLLTARQTLVSIVAGKTLDYLRRHPEMESRLTKGGKTTYLTSDTAEFFEKGALLFGIDRISAESVVL